MKRSTVVFGSTDSAVILGLSPWLTRVELYWKKRGSLPERDWGKDSADPCSELFYHVRIRKIMAEAYRKLTGNRVRACRGLFRHPEQSLFVCHAHYQVSEALFLHCVQLPFRSGEWDESGSGSIPPRIMAEIQWKLGVIPGAGAMDLAVLSGTGGFSITRIVRDDSLIDLLQRRVEAFFRSYVLPGIPPPPLCEEEVRQLYPLPEPVIREADAGERNLIRRYDAARKNLAVCQQKADRLKEQLILKIGSMEGLNCGGVPAVTFRASRSGIRQLKLVSSRKGKDHE